MESLLIQISFIVKYQIALNNNSSNGVFFVAKSRYLFPIKSDNIETTFNKRYNFNMEEGFDYEENNEFYDDVSYDACNVQFFCGQN